MMIPAKYENGVFRPLERVSIREGTVVEVHVPAEGEPSPRRRSIKDLPFYGMWADCDDIAATAIAEGLTLVSRNRKHFQMIGELSLEVPNY